MTTKKVDTTGRFGSRYGVGIRKRVKKIEQKQKAQDTCPKCGLNKVKREAAGIFYCTKCGAKFSGGAYLPRTMTGSIVKKIINQKAFALSAMELEKIKHEEERNMESAAEIQEEKPKAKKAAKKSDEEADEEVAEKADEEVAEKADEEADKKEEKKE